MAGFSEAQHQVVIDKLTSGLGELSAKLDTVPGKAQASANSWWVPEPVAKAIIWCGEKICELGSWVLNKIKELLEGAVAPIYMFIHGYQLESIKGMADGVAGEIQPGVLGSTGSWHGDAATAYTQEIAPQSAAAASIASIAGSAADALYFVAAASLAFYIALGVILVKFIAAVVATIAALGSVVFSWAGLAIMVEEAGVNTAVIGTAVAALVTLLGAEASKMGTLHGLATDNSKFPGGHWPTAVRGT